MGVDGRERDGLTSAEVAERVARGDVNDVPPAPTRTVAQILRANLFTRFNALLGGLLAVILVTGQLQDALFGLVLVANILIGVVQELRAKRTLDRLSLLTAPRATALRDGERVDLSVGEVVLDDVLLLEAGNQVVVDGKVLTSDGLEIDESLLTGESDPVLKHPRDEALSGSFVVAGSGSILSTRVGRDAYAARIADDARRFTLAHSELLSGINRILTAVTIAIVPTATLLFVSQIGAHSDWRDAMAGAVAGTVAMVPEGLVLLTSLAFAVAVVRLARRRVLVQQLPAIEGLARVDVLCIDKTGTLTEGRLVVERIESLDAQAPSEHALTAIAATDPSPNATMRAIGERFQGPLLHPWNREGGVPFSSGRKWSAASFANQGTWVLGAPEILASAMSGGEPQIRDFGEEFEQGRRVLLLAEAASLDGMDLPQGMKPVAAVVLGDRIREDAGQTLRYFERQNVSVKVISGDHPRTVAAVAQRLGLAGADDPVDARELPEDQVSMSTLLDQRSVFGRVTPQQKRQMIRALQDRGHVVAMTGDGVNDALALKDADIGVAMGSGSEATRAVAQLVLLDSTFDSLPQVVGEGRRVLANIERTSGLYLTKTVYAMLLSLAVGVAGFVFPFLPRHLTLVSAVTIGIPSFFLALAPNQERFRPGFVSRVARFAIPAGALAAIATYLAYILARDQANLNLREEQTAAVMALTWIGLLVLAIVASPVRGWRLGLLWGMGALFFIALALPTTRSFFALDPPSLLVSLAAFGIAALVWSLARLFLPSEGP